MSTIYDYAFYKMYLFLKIIYRYEYMKLHSKLLIIAPQYYIICVNTFDTVDNNLNL